MKTLFYLLLALCALAASPVFADETGDYVRETDPLVVKKLADW